MPPPNPSVTKPQMTRLMVSTRPAAESGISPTPTLMNVAITQPTAADPSKVPLSVSSAHHP